MVSVISILVVNPNSSEAMTSKIKETILSLGYPNTKYVFFTAPHPSPKSIDSDDDANVSADVCRPLLQPLISQHDGVLVACYSRHPLVRQLGFGDPPVIGIFEASITTALNLLARESHGRFGIVTTGKAWEEPLSYGVRHFLAGTRFIDEHPPELERFAGVKSTGLSARELHELDETLVKDRLAKSTSDLLKSDIRVLCLGCAGMTGFEDAVQLGCQYYHGGEVPAMRKVKVVDSVKAGVTVLQGLIRGGF